VLAPADGVVIYVDNDQRGAGGKELAINHTGPTGKNFTTVYLHLSEIYVKKGAYVKQGAVIAKSGATGYVNGPHLHFHIWNSSRGGSYDSHTIPIERLVLKQVGVDSDFREYDSRKGDLNDSKVAGKDFESNNIPLPYITIYTDKKSYNVGETQTLKINIKNQDGAYNAQVKIWLEIPIGFKIIILDNTMLLPANLNYGFKNTFTLPNIQSGSYTWYAQLTNTSTGVVISTSSATWTFTGTTSLTSEELKLQSQVLEFK